LRLPRLSAQASAIIGTGLGYAVIETVLYVWLAHLDEEARTILETLKTCEHCGQPRDNNHDTLCPMCLYRTEIKTWLASTWRRALRSAFDEYNFVP